MSDTFASLFSGGGLADIGAMQAGLLPSFGVEYEPKIAEFYRRNLGEHIIASKVQDVDYATLEAPYWLHMSPPCINASQAKVVKDGVRETELDIEMARACCKAIEVLRPPMVSLENVWNYRNFPVSFPLILRTLHEQGYNYAFWHLNSASYGVAQTRKRLILVASRVQRVRKPVVTHRKAQKETGQLSLIPPLPNWVGWYGAIEDILHTLPDDEFAPWQVPLLPPELQTMLLANGQYNGKLVVSRKEQPSMAITANSNQGRLKAVLVNQNSEMGIREDCHRRMTVLSSGKSAYVRAVLLRGDNQGQEWGRGYRDDKEPAVTVTSAKGQKAFIVDGKANDRGSRVTTRDSKEPLFGVTSSTGHKETIRAYTGGRVVRMTPRALARFQSVPDSYILPDATGLACTIIGNGVPCLLMQRVIEANHER